MPDPDDRMTTWPEADSPGTHPVLEAMAEAVGVVNDTAAYLSPTRQFDEPSLEEDDWPRDLDSPETLRMVGHLADVAYGASRCISGISCQHVIPDAAKPQLDVIADLLADADRKLSTLTETPGRAVGRAKNPNRARRSSSEAVTMTLVRYQTARSKGALAGGQPRTLRAAWDADVEPVPIPAHLVSAVPLPRSPSAASSGSRPGDPRYLAHSPEMSRNATAAPARDGAAAHSRPSTCRTAITRRNRQELAMPDQEHLILVLARDAEEITRDISVFFAPTRDFIEPDADWPQDLTGAELAALIPYLRRTIGSLSDVITHVVADNRADPDKARVVAEGVRLIDQGEEAIRAGETLFGTPPDTRSQQHMAAQDFPDVAATGPVGGVAPEAGLAVPSRPGNNQGPVTRHPR